MVTTLPARLLMRTALPFFMTLTSWPMRICMFSPGLSPNAAHMAIMRPM